MGKKLVIGWFSFSCCEDSTIVFTELMNDHWDQWKDLLEIRHARILKSKNRLEGLDVAFVEGAIARKDHEKKVKEIRANCKKLVAIGSCACTGGPSAQRNRFDDDKKKAIDFLMKKFSLAPTVKKLEDVVKVDAKVPGCPMSEKAFLAAVDAMLKEFKII